jgi:hypothetical protein
MGSVEKCKKKKKRRRRRRRRKKNINSRKESLNRQERAD